MADMDEEFPPGLRFVPTDVEVLQYYLLPKLHGRYISPQIVPVVDIYLCEPQALPGFTKGEKSFYFTPRVWKHVNGKRQSRGIKGQKDFWKMTNKITKIRDKNGLLLGRKTSVAYFKKGDAKGPAIKTKYLMQEYVLDDSQEDPTKSDKLNNMVLCAIYLHQPSKTEKKTQPRKKRRQNLRDNLDSSPQRVEVQVNDSPVNGEEQSALISNEKQHMGVEKVIYENFEALMNDNMARNPIRQSIRTPSTLDEFIATGDHYLDFGYEIGHVIGESGLDLPRDDFEPGEGNELNHMISNFNPRSASIEESEREDP